MSCQKVNGVMVTVQKIIYNIYIYIYIYIYVRLIFVVAASQLGIDGFKEKD